MGVRLAIGMTLLVLGAGKALAEDPPRVLFLSKSSGFQHSSITEKDGKPNHVATVLQELADLGGVELTSTKDASLINAENLKNYNLVIFYTTAYLTTLGTDNQPPMGDSGRSRPPST